jgi:hypothetical protein
MRTFVSSDAVTTCRPSGLNVAPFTCPSCPARTANNALDFPSHKRAVLSWDTVTRRPPSPLNSPLHTWSLCPASILSSSPLTASHSQWSLRSMAAAAGISYSSVQRDQVPASGTRTNYGVRQRYRRGAAAAAGGPDLQCLLYDQASWQRYGIVHQPLHRCIA